jgi:hypothetical protein
MTVDEQISANIGQGLELRTELYREGDSLELRYRVANQGKEPVVLVNFITRDYIADSTNLNPAMAELQADGTLKLSQRVLDEGSPPSSIPPIHTYTLLSPGKEHENKIQLAPKSAFWDAYGFNLIPLPKAQKIIFCLGVVPASNTYLKLVEGEPKVSPGGSQLLSQQTLICSQPIAIK